MEEDYNNFKRKIALDPEGRFIPYIGKQYQNGIGNKIHTVNLRILIIGPRHYCDASYSSRNLLAYMSDEMREALSKKTDATFPPGLKVGCTETSAKECLKLRYDKCPVYLAEQNAHCPLGENCKIRCQGTEEEGLLCHRKRNLRCETLYAIHEFLNKPSIESARLGLTYFDSITKFIIEEFHYVPNKNAVAQDVWDRVAFVNLIQRYIPLKDTNFDSKTIGRYIEREDISFCKQVIIDNLKPDYIIMTMPCIEYALRTILGCEYALHKAYKSSGWYVYKAKKSNSLVVKSNWEVLCAEFFQNYSFPSSSITCGEEIHNLVEVLSNDNLTSGLPTKRRVKSIRAKILEAIWMRLKKSKTIPNYANSVKCLNVNLELAHGESTMRKWIANAHKANKGYNIRWTIDEITKWLNERR